MNIENRISELEELIEEREIELQDMKEELDSLYIMQVKMWHKEVNYQNREYERNVL